MEKSDEYKTIKEPSEGIYKDKGSKFLAFAFPVANEGEVKAHQAALKKRYYDARHHVYAFRIEPDKSFFRSSDDGEPSNSSGPPVLGQIQSFDLTNILIVVVRYFGGTKLGIPGLINAYRAAAADAIHNATIITVVEKGTLEIRFQYPSMGDVMRIIKDNDLEIVEQELLVDCRIQVSIAKGVYDEIVGKFEDLRSCNLSEIEFDV
ncbi:MAG: YigZ family protein [Salinivirgaceae bacterium]|nr:YigZ family protein [Salinivirgaceae bacterium]MDD4746958.1 YigZ family protein [Salinivirgaceae bacterium]MDY0281679.1 YigZ family protein [Salinivirgaceae bacterium]